MDKLTKFDYEDLKSLIALTDSIWSTFQKMLRLEQLGEKNTIEFQNTVLQLQSSLQVEQIIYTRIESSSLKLREIYKHLAMQSDIEQYNHDWDILLKTPKNVVLERILKHFSKAIINDQVQRKRTSNRKNEFHLIAQNFYEMFSLERSISEDNLACFLTILNQYIESPSCQDIRTKLLEKKYLLSFCDPFIESILLDYQFEIPKQIYLSSPLQAFFIQKNKDQLDIHKTIFGREFLYDQIPNMLTNFHRFSDLNQKCDAIVMIALFRSHLLLLSKKDIQNVYQYFHETIHSDFYRSVFPENTIEPLLEEAFQQTIKDQEIPVSVTFVKTK